MWPTILTIFLMLTTGFPWNAADAAGIGTFEWPVTSPNITQDYSCMGDSASSTGCYLSDKYHTGIDMTSGSSDQIIYAAEAGTVFSMNNTCDPGIKDCYHNGWGNAVVLQHDNALYSLYGHMEKGSIPVATGQTVTKGQKIGVMGNTGNATGVHLHFEIKSNPDLWAGYTASHPDANGYFDPWKYISSTHIDPVPIRVVNAGGLNIRRGPGTNYVAFTTVNYDQQYVAFARSGEWYRVYVPCSHNTCAGWISKTYSTCTGGICSEETPSATQVEVKNTGTLGLLVRPSPDNSLSLDKIWDSQRFITFGSPQCVFRSS